MSTINDPSNIQVSFEPAYPEIPYMFGGDAEQVYVDYLGPDVDTGFRLAACGGRGQVIVSSHLVHLVSELNSDSGAQFHYVGRKVLKGVYSGRPYPLFLMTMTDLMPVTWEWEAEGFLGLEELGRGKPMPPETICEMLDKIETTSIACATQELKS